MQESQSTREVQLVKFSLEKCLQIANNVLLLKYFSLKKHNLQISLHSHKIRSSYQEGVKVHKLEIHEIRCCYLVMEQIRLHQTLAWRLWQ